MGRNKFLLTLTIKEPCLADGGMYRCNAFNPFGDSNANIDLNFESEKAPHCSIVVFRFLLLTTFQPGTRTGRRPSRRRRRRPRGSPPPSQRSPGSSPTTPEPSSP